MIPALLLGRKGSVGFPGKNTYKVLNRALMEYPLLSALNTKSIDQVFISTDDEKIKEIGKKHGATIIDRPAYLCTNEALGEDAYVHGYKYIKENYYKDIDIIVMLFCNAPCILPSILEEGIRVLKENPDIDSAVTVSKYNMYSPIRARKINKEGLLEPFVPFDVYEKTMKIDCDRDSQGDVYFADVSGVVTRARCLENIDQGLLPQKWMGRKIYPLKQWGGLDVDYEWQIPQIEFWLKKHGFTEDSLPYELK